VSKQSRQSGSPDSGVPEPADFETAIEQIEQIIERIESGEIGLEDSIAQYERGVGLIRRCRQVLDRAEQRVEELTGQMQEDAAREATGRGGTAPAQGRAGEEESEPPF
jgi:exodeoxyribonuclease VII small subunit